MLVAKFRMIALAAAVCVAVAAGSSLLLAQRQENGVLKPAQAPAAKGPRAAKEDLTPATFPKLQALIRPQDNEWRHLRVHWLTDVVAARKKAAAEDKPIIVLRTGGAGYNDPLGSC
jgi:hypothetical protein